ncbi:phosphotransferase enzyme family protein [Actinomadura scrupuli]|uniref:phosphotransferase enzyme family protein n=1 Tax=Actinomadura scrupuli TaxID=559629 RepID=UPI003D994C4A
MIDPRATLHTTRHIFRRGLIDTLSTFSALPRSEGGVVSCRHPPRHQGRRLAQSRARSVAWRWIATRHYGHRIPQLQTKPRQCYSLHITYNYGGQKYVMSRVRKETGRVPFQHQFNITQRLHNAGLKVVHPAVAPTSQAQDAPWVEWRTHYWFVRKFIEHVPIPDWSSQDLIDDVAVWLAKIHRATTLFEGGLESSPEVVTSYDWPLLTVLDRSAELLRGMEERHLSGTYIAMVRRGLQRLERERLDLNLGPVGLIHQDVRPENVLVQNGKVAAVIDWDRARWDYHLYDAVVGALNLAHRQAPGRWIEVASRFLCAYRDESDAEFDENSVAWMIRFAATRNLAVSRSPDKWAALLQNVTNTPNSVTVR